MKTKMLKIVGLALFGVVAMLLFTSTPAMTEPLVKAQQATGHISNGSGNVETDAVKMTLQGLVGRFSSEDIRPGNREILAIAAALCDAGTIVNTTVSILPDIVSGTPSIAGGLAALPCITLGGSDGLHTGVNGAILTFSGPLAQHMGTVRMYADLNFDGRFFQGGDLVAQVVPQQGSNGSVIAQFGRGQGQFLATSNGNALIVPDVPALIAALAPLPLPSTIGLPRILLFTVDISSTATGGRVDVALGLQVGDDTAQGMAGFCANSFTFLPPVARFPCGSNIRGGGPLTSFFDIVGSGGGAIPPGGPPPPGPPPGPPPPSGGGSSLSSYDSNSDCRIDNSEFFNLVDAWLNEVVTDSTFFDGIDYWVGDTNICMSASSAEVSGFSLDSISTSKSLSGDAYTFRAEGRGIASSEVEVYSLNGHRVFAQRSDGAQLSWRLNGTSGSLANGVYLYNVSVRSADGALIRSDVKRLIVMR